MTDVPAKIVYTLTDEAPLLASYSLLPIIKAFTKVAGIEVVSSDISLASRILASFPEDLTQGQRVNDALVELGELVLDPSANIIKLPNISASTPQLQDAIAELQSHGYTVPDYPESPKTPLEEGVKARYSKVLGSAVNPVLREGNSDRRAAAAVKQFAQKHPHRMGVWDKHSRTHVGQMSEGDFYGNEQSVIVDEPCHVKIELVDANGVVTVLKPSVAVLADEILDASFMSKRALCEFFEAQMEEAKQQGVLFSLHVKATMMKVSDPIIFGHCSRIFLKDFFAKHSVLLDELGVDMNNGLESLYAKIKTLPNKAERKSLYADMSESMRARPALAMVDSEKGESSLRVPNDIIIDASMPAMIRDSGKMWNADGDLQDTKAVIPDRCYAGIFQETIDNCKAFGAFDPSTMGSVANVGLMAQKAEEYGSHDKTFEIPTDGIVRIIDDSGTVLMEHAVEAGDIWRACQLKDEPIRDWVKLAVKRARITATPAIFWLDENRAHDRQVIIKVNTYLKDHDTEGLDIRIMAPQAATRFSLTRIRDGLDTISVTGNVLRDYLTDLFPIMELGTSAKMLSIVPLMRGGGLFETGAGGSAPKHVQQFVQEGHLRWDSLGEFLALSESLDQLALAASGAKAKVLAEALAKANSRFLDSNKSPSRKVKELDNRGSHFYLALYWARALAEQNDDVDMKRVFVKFSSELKAAEAVIINELNSAQGEGVKLGGYYQPQPELMAQAMRPSAVFNAALASIG